MSETTILRTEQLKKSYEKGKYILNNFTFSIQKGEVVVIVGPSGCGKSTFLRCLNLLEPIDSGSIYLEEQLISAKDKNASKIREKIGMVFQSYDLFPHKTILDNLLLAPVKVQKRNKKEVEQEAEELNKKKIELDLEFRKEEFLSKTTIWWPETKGCNR